MNLNFLHKIGHNIQKAQNFSIQKQQQLQQQSKNQNANSNDMNSLINSNDLIDSSNNYDHSFLLKKQLFQQQQQKVQQQQQQNRLLQIENEIQKTYAFYVQNLNERRDYLLKVGNYSIYNGHLLSNETNFG